MGVSVVVPSVEAVDSHCWIDLSSSVSFYFTENIKMKVLAALSGALVAVAALPAEMPAGLAAMQVNVCPNYPFCNVATPAAAPPVVPGLDQFNKGVALIKQLEQTYAPVYPVPGSAKHYADQAAQLALMGHNPGFLYHGAQVNRAEQAKAQWQAYAASL